MRGLKMEIFVLFIGVGYSLPSVAVCARERLPLGEPDTTKGVIVNNYYYGGSPYLNCPPYTFYPRYVYHYPRVFFGIHFFHPFQHRAAFHRFPFHRGHRFGRHVGYFHSPGMRGIPGRGRY
jgi:hypothetical protein